MWEKSKFDSKHMCICTHSTHTCALKYTRGTLYTRTLKKRVKFEVSNCLPVQWLMRQIISRCNTCHTLCWTNKMNIKWHFRSRKRNKHSHLSAPAYRQWTVPGYVMTQFYWTPEGWHSRREVAVRALSVEVIECLVQSLKGGLEHFCMFATSNNQSKLSSAWPHQ